jgi:chitodextrinase
MTVNATVPRMRSPKTRVLVGLGAVALLAAGVALTATMASAAGSVTATFSKDSDWGTGYQAKYTIANGTSATINSWTVAFDLPSGLTFGTYWDATVTVSGQHVVAKARDYNAVVAPGGSASFGFLVSGGSGAPVNCTVNGASCSGGGSSVPGTPSGVHVTGTTSTSISLAWTASSGTVSGYRVYEGSSVRTTVTGTSATLSGLAAGSTHTYTVTAFNSTGESGHSASVTATTGTGTGAPGTPVNVHVTGSTSSSISLGWSASAGTVSGYRVYEGSTLRTTVTATSATLGSLAACSTHTYAVAAFNTAGESGRASVTGSTSGCPTGGGALAAAPYLYFGWGDPPSPTSVMSATGVKAFTLAFMLSGGGCTPMWDSQRPLTGGVDQQNINAIRAAGGDVEVSFGGWQGNKLGPNCSSASALAGAYQQVINAYKLKAIDIDIENTDEFENATVQDRILSALKIVKQNNPGIKTIVTFGTATTGPTPTGIRLVDQSKALGSNIDVYTLMPFDFGSSNVGADTQQSIEALKAKLMSTFGWSAATAYAHIGISSMNGITDSNETVSPATFQSIRDYAQQHHLARLAFWSVNRDRPCPGGGVAENCSGISQTNWQFTKINATFTG